MEFCCSSKTKLDWIPSRSAMVGLTSFCYIASFPWGGWGLWLLQTFLSFMSDYVYIGRDSRFHILDRVLASSQTVIFMTLAISTGIQWYEIMGGVFAIIGYFVGKIGVKKHNFDIFCIGHTVWHVASLTLISVMSRNCDFIFDDTCTVKRVKMIWCDCWSSHRPVFELVLFALLLIYAGWILSTLQARVKSAIVLLA